MLVVKRARASARRVQIASLCRGGERAGSKQKQPPLTRFFALHRGAATEDESQTRARKKRAIQSERERRDRFVARLCRFSEHRVSPPTYATTTLMRTRLAHRRQRYARAFFVYARAQFYLAFDEPKVCARRLATTFRCWQITSRARARARWLAILACGSAPRQNASANVYGRACEFAIHRSRSGAACCEDAALRARACSLARLLEPRRQHVYCVISARLSLKCGEASLLRGKWRGRKDDRRLWRKRRARSR